MTRQIQSIVRLLQIQSIVRLLQIQSIVRLLHIIFIIADSEHSPLIAYYS